MRLKTSLATIFLAATGNLAVAQLTLPENKMTDYVNAHINDAISLLTESVNINSGTLNKAGVKKVGELYLRELKKLGFTTEWIAEPDALNRAGHLVATHMGKKGKRIILLG